MNIDRDVRVQNPVEIKGANGRSLNMIPDRAEVVVPNVLTTLPVGILYIGNGGNVTVRPAGNTSWVTFKGIANGTFLPVYITGVSEAITTTAADMLICY